MIRKIALIATLLLSVATISAQELITGVDFTTRFDNREYAGTTYPKGSETHFAMRLTPHIGLQWEGRNRLMVGVELFQNFGEETEFLTSAKPQVWYQYEAPNVLAVAGIFPRTLARGNYGELFYDRAYLFNNNLLHGVMGQYRSENGFVEMLVDWEGMQSATNREKFRILSSGEYTGNFLYGGYKLSLQHYAKTSNPQPNEGVVDNILINPYGGFRFSAYFDFDVRIGYIQSLQRDRITESGWKAPKGGELNISMSRWGLTLSNTLYLGQNLMPFYDIYGSVLYTNCVFYGTTKKIYNRTDISYSRRFFNKTLGVTAGMFFHYDGVGLGMQQLLRVDVSLQKIFSKKEK